MTRKIIQIDEEKCIGCGLCASACQQSALKIIDGKAKLISNDYCDGLGKCMPKCPVDAISFSDIDVTFKEGNKKNDKETNTETIGCDCPTLNMKKIDLPTIQVAKEALSPARDISATTRDISVTAHGVSATAHNVREAETNLNQWPVQIKLAPVTASYFENANLLIAADCTAYAYGNFHNDFMKNKITLIGCPKLDDGDYTEKLTTILETNNLNSVTIIRMDVPCCRGIENSVKTALKNCSKMIQWQLITISTDGKILGERSLTL